MYADGVPGSLGLPAEAAARIERFRTLRCFYIEQDPDTLDDRDPRFSTQLWEAFRGPTGEVAVTQSNGRQRRQLTPEQEWEIFLEVTTQQLT